MRKNHDRLRRLIDERREKPYFREGSGESLKNIKSVIVRCVVCGGSGTVFSEAVARSGGDGDVCFSCNGTGKKKDVK